MKKVGWSSILVATLVLGFGVAAEAQQPAKVPRIGYLSSSSDSASESTRFEAIRRALRELGYIEGQNIAIEYRYAEGKIDRFTELAAELVRLKVDIIVVAAGDAWVRAAMNATKTVPIVMVGNEMCRVTKTAGIVATTMWDRSAANQLYGCFWDAVEAIDTTAKRPFGRQGSYGSIDALSQLWNGAGLIDIEGTDLLMRCQFSSFDELWQRCLNAEGPAGVCMERLSADRREALKAAMRQNVLGNGPDEPFSLKAKAWAVRGVVP
jgi:hypothetical protein